MSSTSWPCPWCSSVERRGVVTFRCRGRCRLRLVREERRFSWGKTMTGAGWRWTLAASSADGGTRCLVWIFADDRDLVTRAARRRTAEALLRGRRTLRATMRAYEAGLRGEEYLPHLNFELEVLPP